MARTGRLRRKLSEQWQLTIYIAGDTPMTLTALDNLRRICRDYFNGSCQIEVVDLLEKPAVARAEHIVVVPTVVRKRPLPVKKVFGDLTDIDAVVTSLEMRKTS